MQNKLDGCQIAGLIGIVVAFLVSFFLLFGPDKTFFSVSAWIAEAVRPDEEIAVMLILPVYMAAMVFGGGLLGWMLGGKAYNFVHHR